MGVSAAHHDRIAFMYVYVPNITAPDQRLNRVDRQTAIPSLVIVGCNQ